MRLRWLGLALIGAVGLGCAAAWAQQADRDLPLTFDAAQLKIDGKRRVQVLTGAVEITRGTLVIKANLVELRDIPGGQAAQALGSASQPATFKQKRDGVDEVVEGQALRIDYDGVAQTVQFSQQAQVRVYRAGVLADQITGQTIVYDHSRDAFDVQGAAADGSGSGRVRGVVSPRPASAPSAAPVPGASR